MSTRSFLIDTLCACCLSSFAAEPVQADMDPLTLYAVRSTPVGHVRGAKADRNALRVPLRSDVVLVVDLNTGDELLAKNPQRVVPIASITKLMTALVVLHTRAPLDEVLTIASDDVDRLKNSSSRLRVGVRLTRREMLQLALMSSENRAAHALARSHPGGESEFIADMNATARQLGMHSTSFTDPTGLSPSNRSTARDLARLVRAASKVPLLSQLSTMSQHSVSFGRRRLLYRNTNRLIHRDDWDIELQKTGFINEAGKCLAMQARIGVRSLVMILLDGRGPSVRVRDAENIKRWLRMNPAGRGRQVPRANRSLPSARTDHQIRGRFDRR